MDLTKDIQLAAEMLADALKKELKLTKEDLEKEAKIIEPVGENGSEKFAFTAPQALADLKLISRASERKIKLRVTEISGDSSKDDEVFKMWKNHEVVQSLDNLFWCICRQMLEDQSGPNLIMGIAKDKDNKNEFIITTENQKERLGGIIGGILGR